MRECANNGKNRREKCAEEKKKKNCPINYHLVPDGMYCLHEWSHNGDELKTFDFTKKQK